jgi:hypothetical protein
MNASLLGPNLVILPDFTGFCTISVHGPPRIISIPAPHGSRFLLPFPSDHILTSLILPEHWEETEARKEYLN